MKPKILIVDDDEGLRIIMEAFLKERGFETLTAANGKEGLKIVRSHNIDLVISDIDMPVMDGLRFLWEIRKRKLKIEVIMMSGTITDTRKKEISGLGAFYCFQKPFSMSTELIVKVAEALKHPD